MALTRTLPGTDLALTPIGFGCWAIGGQYWGDDIRDDVSIAAVRRAVELGVNWFDTAPLYGDGHADTVLAQALGPAKHDVVIATKVGPRMDPSTGHALSDLTPENIVRDVEGSLKRLGLDVIPLLQVHWPCNLDTPLERSLEALVGLIDAGKVRYIGLSNYDAETLQRAKTLAPIVSLQTPYSMVRREYERELQAVCAGAERDATEGAALDDPKRALGVVAYEPLCRGLLTGKFGATPPTFPDSDLRSRDARFQQPAYGQIHQLNRALAVIAAKLGVPHAALPAAWVAAQPTITSAIVGAKRPEQVEQTWQAMRLIERTDVWDALAGYIDRVRP